MPEQIIAQHGSDAHGRFGRKVLSRQGTGQAHDAQKYQHSAHTQNIPHILVFDSHIDDLSHDEGHKQFKAGFQQFEEGPQNTFQLIAFKVF